MKHNANSNYTFCNQHLAKANKNKKRGKEKTEKDITKLKTEMENIDEAYHQPDS